MDETSNIEFYDDLWLNSWQDMERYNPTARHLQRMIVELVGRCRSVSSLVDVGCGMGVNIRSLVEAFPSLQITGTDLSPKILAVAKRFLGTSPQIQYATLDLGKQALDHQFDVVLCNQVLEHIEEDVNAIRNLDRMCGRYLLITVPGGKYNSTSRLVGHFRHYAKQELLGKVLPLGYRVVHVREWGFPAHSLYKLLLGSLSANTQRVAGLGKYGLWKKMVSGGLYWSFYANVFDRGANVILLAEKSH